MVLAKPKQALRTYSRQKPSQSDATGPPLKRRRLEGDNEPSSALSTRSTSSSPFESSKPTSPAATPPSSPPPVITASEKVEGRLRNEPPVGDALSTKCDISTLREASINVQRPSKPAKRKRLVQMQLDIGDKSSKKCRVCGMEYIPCNAEDVALHKKFHAAALDGPDMGRAFTEGSGVEVISRQGSGTIVCVSRRAAVGARRRAKEALKVVNTELSAVEIPDADLWGTVSGSLTAERPPSKPDGAQQPEVRERDDRFRVYLHLKGTKCVGLCLVEKISEGYAVLDETKIVGVGEGPKSSRSSSISVSTKADPCIMGVSRIWTSARHRKEGIARSLLDAGAEGFVYGAQVPKEKVAFSQPTESGANLARSWFGKDVGWHVYTNGSDS